MNVQIDVASNEHPDECLERLHPRLPSESGLPQLALQKLDVLARRIYPFGIWTRLHCLSHSFRKCMTEESMPEATSGHPLLRLQAQRILNLSWAMRWARQAELWSGVWLLPRCISKLRNSTIDAMTCDQVNLRDDLGDCCICTEAAHLYSQIWKNRGRISLSY